MNVVGVSVADDLAGAGMVVGSRAPIIKRIPGLLDQLERAGRVERVPDGRYRTFARADSLRPRRRAAAWSE